VACTSAVSKHYGDNNFSELHQYIQEHMGKHHDELTDSHTGFCGLFLAIFLATHPLVNLMDRNIVFPRSLRAMLAWGKSVGAMTSSAFFFSASGSAMSDSSDPQCQVGSFAEAVIKNILIGIVGFLISGLPVIVLVLLHKRKMTYIQSDEEAEKILKTWRRKDIAIWILGPLYTTFCSLYLLSFQANVADLDSLKWGASGVTSLLISWMAVPLNTALAMAFLGWMVARHPEIHVRSREIQKAGLEKGDVLEDDVFADDKDAEAFRLDIPSDGPFDEMSYLHMKYSCAEEDAVTLLERAEVTVLERATGEYRLEKRLPFGQERNMYKQAGWPNLEEPALICQLEAEDVKQQDWVRLRDYSRRWSLDKDREVEVAQVPGAGICDWQDDLEQVELHRC